MARRLSYSAQRLQDAWAQVLRLPDQDLKDVVGTAFAIARDQGVSIGHVPPMLCRLRSFRKAGQEPSGVWSKDRHATLPAA